MQPINARQTSPTIVQRSRGALRRRKTLARSIRPAGPEDAAAISDLVRASYTKYVERIGKEPAPMLEDYAALIGAGEVWASVEGEEVLGVLVMRPAEDHLFVDNVAVSRPGSRGGAWSASSWPSRRRRRRSTACRRYGSTPTRRCTRTWTSTPGWASRRPAGASTGATGASSCASGFAEAAHGWFAAGSLPIRPSAWKDNSPK